MALPATTHPSCLDAIRPPYMLPGASCSSATRQGQHVARHSLLPSYTIPVNAVAAKVAAPGQSQINYLRPVRSDCPGRVASVDEDSRRHPEVVGKLLDVRERERALAAEHLGNERFAAQDRDEIDLPQIVRLHEKAQRVHSTARGYRDVGLLVGLDQVGERIQVH